MMGLMYSRSFFLCQKVEIGSFFLLFFVILFHSSTQRVLLKASHFHNFLSAIFPCIFEFLNDHSEFLAAGSIRDSV